MAFFFGRRKRNELSKELKRHFAPASLDKIIVTQRSFPGRMRADLQRAIDTLFNGEIKVSYFRGMLIQRFGQEVSLAALVSNAGMSMPTAPLYEDVDVGEDSPVRCLESGLWLGAAAGGKFALLLTKGERRMGDDKIHVQVGVIGATGTAIIDGLFD